MKSLFFSFIALLCFLMLSAGCGSAAATTPLASPPVTSPVTPPASNPSAPPDLKTTPASAAAAGADWSPDGVISAGEYAGSSDLGDYSIFWRSDEMYIYIGMTAKTSGWVAMALQPGSLMKGADMILGLVKDGKVEVRDLFCTDNFGTHPEDTALGGTYDILVSGGKEENGSTTIEFKRLLNTGDKQDIPIQKGVNKIIWSYSSGDDPSIKHMVRGYAEIKP